MNVNTLPDWFEYERASVWDLFASRIQENE